MRKTLAITCSLLACLFTGCKKDSKNSDWDDNTTAGNYKNKLKSFWDNGGDVAATDSFRSNEEDFIPLSEEDLKAQFADGAIPQSMDEPGSGGKIPGIEHFKAPSSQLAAIFKNLLFNTDDHILRGKETLASVERIASYLRDHPNTYVFVEGHCDERGPEAYNLALGARRANYVRTLLVQKGVSHDQIFTVSYGKERPLDNSHSSQAWSKNRRAQFKIFNRT